MARKKLKNMMETAMPMPDENWQAENDLRTLQSAAEVMNDPARIKKCKALHADQMKGMEKMGMGKGKMKGGEYE